MTKVLEIFWRFLVLGCMSFGGPAAHIGYFHRAFVEKLKWLDDTAYSGLIALSQFLPGPGSSQIGFAIGLKRAGLLGGIAAFLGFTIPSFILLFLLSGLQAEGSFMIGVGGLIHGLKLFAVVVVADATIKLGKSFCTNTLAIGLAGGTAVFLWILPTIWTQMGMIVVGALVGFKFGSVAPPVEPKPGRLNRWALVLFFLLLALFPVLMMGPAPLALWGDFYQAGSLVFGGGHVVLPLLEQLVGDDIPQDRFLAGYAAAQAIPGPMFSLAAFLGAELLPGQRIVGAGLATAGIFLPGFLLVIGLHESWESVANRKGVASAIWGINATVVGFLTAALYTPVFVSAVHHGLDMALVLIGLFLVRWMKVPILPVIFVFGLAGWGMSL